jgi:hypothetical protein
VGRQGGICYRTGGNAVSTNLIAVKINDCCIVDVDLESPVRDALDVVDSKVFSQVESLVAAPAARISTSGIYPIVGNGIADSRLPRRPS